MVISIAEIVSVALNVVFLKNIYREKILQMEGLPQPGASLGGHGSWIYNGYVCKDSGGCSVIKGGSCMSFKVVSDFPGNLK